MEEYGIKNSSYKKRVWAILEGKGLIFKKDFLFYEP